MLKGAISSSLISWARDEQGCTCKSSVEADRPYTAGTAKGQADLTVDVEITIPGSSSKNVDLTALQSDNCQVAFAKVRELSVVNLSETEGDILHVESGTFNDPWGGVGKNVLGPKDQMLISSYMAGFDVGGGVFALTNTSANDVVVSLTVIGTTS